MRFIDLAARRRSVRKFSDRPVEETVIEQIIETTLTAPSSKNLRTSRIGVTRDTEAIEALGRMRSTGTAFVKDAPVVFVVMGDDTQTDLWDINAAISATVLQFAAEDLGLGTCWVQVAGRPHRDETPDGLTAEEYLHEVLPQTKGHRVLCIVAAGYPANEAKPRPVYDDADKVIYM